MPKAQDIARLINVRFGVRFEMVETKSVSDEIRAPFVDNVGIFEGSVVYTKTASVGALVHEAGHIIFGIDEELEEIDWIGWEWAVAKWLNLTNDWIKSSADYVIENNKEIGRLPKDECIFWMERYMNEAKGFVKSRYPNNI